MYADNRGLAIRRAAWGAIFAGVGSLAYYLAYFLIVWRAASGRFSLGDLTFLAGSFLRLRGLLEGLLLGFSQLAGPSALPCGPVRLFRNAAHDRFTSADPCRSRIRFTPGSFSRMSATATLVRIPGRSGTWI